MTCRRVPLFNFISDQGAKPKRQKKLKDRNVKNLLGKTIRIRVIDRNLFETNFSDCFKFRVAQRRAA